MDLGEDRRERAVEEERVETELRIAPHHDAIEPRAERRRVELGRVAEVVDRRQAGEIAGDDPTLGGGGRLLEGVERAIAREGEDRLGGGHWMGTEARRNE